MTPAEDLRRALELLDEIPTHSGGGQPVFDLSWITEARALIDEVAAKLEAGGARLAGENRDRRQQLENIDRQVAELLRERAVIDGTAAPGLPFNIASTPRKVSLVFERWQGAWEGGRLHEVTDGERLEAEMGSFHSGSMFSGWVVLQPGDVEDLEESAQGLLVPIFELRLEETPKRRHSDGQPKAPVVRTLKPEDATPEYLAFMCCRSAICRDAAHLAREGDRDGGKAMLAIMDEYLPLKEGPEEQ